MNAFARSLYDQIAQPRPGRHATHPVRVSVATIAARVVDDDWWLYALTRIGFSRLERLMLLGRCGAAG